MKVGRHDALIVVDAQRDFLSGGPLPVPGAARIFPAINAAIRSFDRVYFTRDPRYGAELSDLLELPQGRALIDKRDAEYSAFAGTNLAADLRAHSIERVFVCGLALDYCVKATAIDAQGHGFRALVVSDATAAYNFEPSDEADALNALEHAGIELVSSSQLSAGASTSASPFGQLAHD
jgi:nicotinamidase/pyrazinamidase